jgi:hypothetical protein
MQPKKKVTFQMLQRPSPPKQVNVPLLCKEMEHTKILLDNMWLKFKP